MSVKEYDLLKKKSKAAGLSANTWLMAQLKANRPTQHREEETRELIRFMDQTGREINAIAKEFNSGHGAEAELNRMLQLLCGIYERVYKLRKKGYPYVG